MESKYCFIKDIILEILKRNFINPKKDNFEYSFLIEENGFIVNKEKFVHFLNQLRFEVNYYAIFEEINKKIIFLKENNINPLFLNKRIK